MSGMKNYPGIYEKLGLLVSGRVVSDEVILDQTIEFVHVLKLCQKNSLPVGPRFGGLWKMKMEVLVSLTD